MSWEIHEAAERIADGWHSELEETRKRNAVLGRENAELRELVRTLHYCTSSGDCDGCPANSDGTAHLMPDDICDTMLDRMHELGIEVYA